MKNIITNGQIFIPTNNTTLIKKQVIFFYFSKTYNQRYIKRTLYTKYLNPNSTLSIKKKKLQYISN